MTGVEPQAAIIEPFLNQGLLGVGLVAVVFFLLRTDRDHKEERREWRETMMTALENNTKAVNDMRAFLAATTGKNGIV